MPTSNSSQFSSELLVSLATVPLLLALVGGRAIADAVQQLGLASEELFRGDRLPILPMTPPAAGISTREES